MSEFKRMTVVFDIDGTLADLSHRLKWIQGEEKNWDKFYEKVEEDKEIKPIAQIFYLYSNFLAPSARLICITGRPERTREATLQWFEKEIGATPDELYMRENHDFRPDVEVKREWVERLRKEGYEFILAFEDRDRIVKMYRDMGIQCCQVAEGAY